MPTTLTNGIQLPDKGSVDWYSSMQSNYNLIDTHLGNTDAHVTAEDKANWNSKQGSLSQAQLDAIAQVATNTDDIATLQSDKADASHTHSSSDITDIGDYATKQYVDNSISGLVDNAPAALDTLKELSTALNDDANFASTVTTALGAKANSADLATVATSGDYDDLSNKPTINDSTITIQKNGSTVDTFTTNGSAKTINIPVPTKTSDLTNDSNFVVSSSLATVATSGFYNDLDNKPYIPDKISDLIDDSNFVDTSNPAVASGITSAKVTDYDAHIADTDIHVTTADKNKWNNNTYVFRYSSTALTASSTNSNALLDNTDNLKVDDKVIDSDGVLFSITAIDTVNSTFTVGSALIDLALDANVVHTSGNETVGGAKTFSSNVNVYNSDTSATTPNLYLRSSKIEISSQGNTSGDQNLTYLDKNNTDYANVKGAIQANGSAVKIRAVAKDSSDNSVINELQLLAFTNGNKAIFPSYSNEIDLGLSNYKWKAVYATNYYYGSNNVEFSTKFVTTDTAQTISGAKTFTDNIVAKKIVSNVSQLPINARSNADSVAIIGGNSASDGGGVWVYGKNTSNKSMVTLQVYDTDNSAYHAVRLNMDGSLTPTVSNNGLGNSSFKWVSFNGLNPGSLSLPDLNNGIDISSYITHLDKVVNQYTPPSNGWLSIRVNKTSLTHTSVMMYQNNGLMSVCETTEFSSSGANLPVIANKNVDIYIYAGVLVSAKFYPCQGNV